MSQPFYYGVDYYPEHWPEERWEKDARLMQEAGLNVVRLAEFAWSKLEPSEGHFDFAWLDCAITTLSAHGIKVVLGTPTASPPPWVMLSDPDMFIVREDGRRATFGNRREYCPTNANYRRHSARIVRAMAEHYRDNRQVIGWQIDNEFGDRCYCPNCQRRFQEWLKERFGTLNAINERWGTIFWSHVYTNWSQIPLPWTTSGAPNPGLALDYARFMSAMYVGYQQEQVDILQEVCPQHFITHNFMGFKYDKINYFDLAEPLDLVSWDNYPRGFWHDDDPQPALLALGHAAMWGLKRKNFWVMEAQSGITGWETMSSAPRPGEIRLWVYQGIAHGADGMVFFRWRSCRFGTEEYWHGILDHDAQLRRRYREVQQMGQELARIGATIAGTEIRAEVAIMHSYDCRFAFQIQPNRADFRYAELIAGYYRALFARNVPVDVISPTADLSVYKLVIVPALYVLTEEMAAHLRQYVEAGGVLIITARSGVKDDGNTVVAMPLPGLLADLCGVEIEEYDLSPAGLANPLQFSAPIVTGGEATLWYDILKPRTAAVMARYTQDYYTGKPAITSNDTGRGKAIYVGTIGDAALAQTVIDWTLELAAVRPILDTPAGVEATVRWQGQRRLLFLLNHNAETQRVTLDGAWLDLLREQRVSGEIELAGRDVCILAEV